MRVETRGYARRSASLRVQPLVSRNELGDLRQTFDGLVDFGDGRSLGREPARQRAKLYRDVDGHRLLPLAHALQPAPLREAEIEAVALALPRET